MPTFKMSRKYKKGSSLDEAKLDSFYGSLEVFVNETKIDQTNIQTGGLTTASFNEVATVDPCLNFTPGHRIEVDAARTEHIADGQVGNVAVADGAITNLNREDYSSLGITSVPVVDLGAGFHELYSEQSHASGHLTRSYLMSTSIVSVGRPVLIQATMSHIAGTSRHFGLYAEDTSDSEVFILRNGTYIYHTQINGAVAGGLGSIFSEPMFIPDIIDYPPVGAVKYEIYIPGSSPSPDTGDTYFNLVVREL